MADELYVRVSLRDLVETHREIKSLFEENAKLKERAEYFKGISEAVTEGSRILSRDWMTAMEENHRLEEENAELKRKLEAWEASGGSFYPLLNEEDYMLEALPGKGGGLLVLRMDMEGLLSDSERQKVADQIASVFCGVVPRGWKAVVIDKRHELQSIFPLPDYAALEKLAWAVVEHDDAENEKIKVERVSDHPISLLKDYLETLKMEE